MRDQAALFLGTLWCAALLAITWVADRIWGTETIRS